MCCSSRRTIKIITSPITLIKNLIAGSANTFFIFSVSFSSNLSQISINYSLFLKNVQENILLKLEEIVKSKTILLSVMITIFGLKLFAQKSYVTHVNWSKDAVIYEVNIRQYTEEGTFDAFSEHLPRLKEMGIDIVSIATAQHREMMDMMLKVFEMKPDYDMNIMTKNQSLNGVAAKVLVKLEEIICKEDFDWIFVQGDTTTAMAGAISAFHKGVKVGHVEAGLRSGDIRDPFPEEMNRRVIDQVSDLLFAPTTNSRKNLLEEGLNKERIVVTGNTVVDALYYVQEKFDLDSIRKKYIEVENYI